MNILLTWSDFLVLSFLSIDEFENNIITIKATATASTMSDSTFSTTPVTERSFHLFNSLNRDFQSAILRFVSEAPLETLPFPRSTLTHTLSLVNEDFRRFSNSDKPWRDSLIRVCQKEPELWLEAIKSIAGINDEAEETDVNEDSIAEIVERARAQRRLDYKSFYRTIVNESLRWTGPIFYMPGVIALGQAYALHFFEPRYRVLIAEVMQGQPQTALNRGPLTAPAYFVHANHGPLEPTIPAVMVRVLQCQMYADGRADVLLLPVQYVWIERVWVRPNSGQLFEAQCLKMGRAATREMVELHRRQTLANIMDQLSHQLSESASSGDDRTGDSETMDDEGA